MNNCQKCNVEMREGEDGMLVCTGCGNFNYPLFLIAGCLIVASGLWFFIDPTKEIVLEKNEFKD